MPPKGCIPKKRTPKHADLEAPGYRNNGTQNSLRRRHRAEMQSTGMHPLSALVFFAWVLAVQLTGLAAFTKGFFLTRVELGKQSQCDVS